MKRPSLFVKFAVVACSVLLAAAFVAYRAGAFEWLTAKPVAKSAPQSAEDITTPYEDIRTPFDPSSREMMGTSKSLGGRGININPGLITHPLTGKPSEDKPATDKPRTILPGSKSAPLIPPGPPNPNGL